MPKRSLTCKACSLTCLINSGFRAVVQAGCYGIATELAAGIIRLGDLPEDPEDKGDYQDKTDDPNPHTRFENASYYPATGHTYRKEEQEKDRIENKIFHVFGVFDELQAYPSDAKAPGVPRPV